jgi:cell division septum initiation protein DivIVA
MTKEEIENYFVESAGYGRDKVRNFMDIVNKALKQKGERITELEKENAELKKEWQEQVQKATDEGYARTLQTVQLSKSKEIIKKFLLWENDWHDKTESKYELLKQAEQFIKDSEVEK